MTISKEEIINEFREAQQRTQSGASQLGGGPEPADQDAAGGSSGTGGYGNAQNQANHQGQTTDPDQPVTRELSRGERYDLEQGGGRAEDAVDFAADLTQSEREREELGQRFIDEHGAVTEGPQP